VTKLANEITITGMPQRCSACFNQQPALRHVDFDAACDRGYGQEEAVKVVMDDLILCESCVKEGARLIGMTDSHELHTRLDALEHQVDVERKLRRQAQNYADTMEDALTKRPEQVQIDHRRKPRKQIAEVA
jgi:hypothetical protein